MIRFILSFLGGIFSFVTLAIVFGALTAGGLFWMYSRDLPSYEALAQYTPPTISRIYNGEGQIIDEFATQRRIYTPIADIPPLVRDAFISAENKTFYVDPGFDVKGIISALLQAALHHDRLRGASTITQQVAKNILLDGSRTIKRKARELILAYRISHAFSKDRVLEIYLNEIFLGANSYGVAAAAQTYFNKTLGQLNPQEAAYLAGLPKAPSDYNPVTQNARAVARRNYVLNQMYLNGYLSKATAETAEKAPLLTVQGGDFPAFRDKLPPRDYFTEEIRRELSDTFGNSEFLGGGLTIRATVDPELQSDAAQALRDGLEQYDRSRGIWRGTGKTLPLADLSDPEKWRPALADLQIARDIPGWYPAVVLSVGKDTANLGIEGVPADAPEGHELVAADVTWARKRLKDGKLARQARVPGDLVSPGDVVFVKKLTDKNGKFLRWSLRQIPQIEGAFMAMDPKTGRVLAMQGGFSYQHSSFNRATQAMRQPGSSFKPIIYGAALDDGFTPATIVIDAPITVNTPQGLWTPKNAEDRYYGPTPMRTGLIHSRNLMTIRIAEEIGMDTVARYAERFGVYDPMKEYLANALGAQETTLFKLMGAYSMIANGGERVTPSLVDRVQDRFGNTVYRHDQRICTDCKDPNLPPGESPTLESNRQRVLDPIADYELIHMMQGVVTSGTAAGRVNLPVPVAGKTGTTNESKDVWFIGFTSNLVAGCYMGFDTPKPLGRGAYGGTMCAPVFNAFMQKAVKRFGGGPFPVPPGGHWVKIDRYTGAPMDPSATGSNVVSIYFRDGDDPGLGIGVVDGGFKMGSNLPLYGPGQDAAEPGSEQVTTSTGQVKTIPKKADFGTVNSGGLY